MEFLNKMLSKREIFTISLNRFVYTQCNEVTSFEAPARGAPILWKDYAGFCISIGSAPVLLHEM